MSACTAFGKNAVMKLPCLYIQQPGFASNMGLPAVQAVGQAPQPGDIVIKGNFYGIEEGRTGKRVLLGFGSGAAELRTAVDLP